MLATHPLSGGLEPSSVSGAEETQNRVFILAGSPARRTNQSMCDSPPSEAQPVSNIDSKKAIKLKTPELWFDRS
jgi:hypothetical protein